MTENKTEKLLELVKNNISSYPDFPQPGILFRDVFAIMRNPSALEAVIELLLIHLNQLRPKPDVIVALEARGFLFGPSLALKLQIPFVPIRKKGKLPGRVTSVSFHLEYGTDAFEIQCCSIKAGQHVVIVDDLLATGGSLKAACSLVENFKGNVIAFLVIIELIDLKGRERLKYPVHSIVQY